jgi:hypothetical protein
MRSWLTRLLALAAALFVVGWALVLASGYGGDSTGGSELVWRVGGIMVYLSVPTLLVALMVALTRVCRLFRHRSN